MCSLSVAPPQEQQGGAQVRLHRRSKLILMLPPMQAGGQHPQMPKESGAALRSCLPGAYEVPTRSSHSFTVQGHLQQVDHTAAGAEVTQVPLYCTQDTLPSRPVLWCAHLVACGQQAP